MVLGGGLGRFARGKPTADDGAPAVAAASTTNQDSNFASGPSMNGDPSSGMEVDSEWMTFGQFSGGTSEFDVPGVGTDFNEFGFQEQEAAGAAMETDFGLDNEEGEPPKQGSSVATAASGLRLFKTAPSVQENSTTTGNEAAVPAGRHVAGPEGIENRAEAGMPRVLPGGTATTAVNRNTNNSDNNSQSDRFFGGNSNDQATSGGARPQISGFDDSSAPPVARTPGNLEHAASRGIRPPQTGDGSPVESIGGLSAFSSSKRGASFPSGDAAKTSAANRREEEAHGNTGTEDSFHSEVPTTSNNWTSNFDPHQGYLTANESTRVIPVPPSADKRPPPRASGPPLGEAQHQHHQDSTTRPFSSMASSGRTNTQPVPPVTPASVGVTKVTGEESPYYAGAQQCPPNPSTGKPRYGSSNSALSTPAAEERRGGSLASNLPAVTPGNDSASRGWSPVTPSLATNALPQSGRQKEPSVLGFPNQEQTPRPSTTTCVNQQHVIPVTPVHDSIIDTMNEESRRDESSSSSSDNPNTSTQEGASSPMNFEDLHANFLLDIRDLKDQQDDNGARLLSMQGLFATAYSESLQDQANLIDLLSGVEKVKEMAEELTSKLEAF
jgi:hypothetical protein